MLGAAGQCLNVVYKAVLKCGAETEDFRSQETTEKNATRAARAHTEWRGQSNRARDGSAVRALAALAEVQGLAPKTDMAAHNSL